MHAELVLDVPVEHGLLLENLLDLAHAPFTHTTTFAKGWPVPGEWLLRQQQGCQLRLWDAATGATEC